RFGDAVRAREDRHQRARHLRRAAAPAGHPAKDVAAAPRLAAGREMRHRPVRSGETADQVANVVERLRLHGMWLRMISAGRLDHFGQMGNVPALRRNWMPGMAEPADPDYIGD